MNYLHLQTAVQASYKDLYFLYMSTGYKVLCIDFMLVLLLICIYIKTQV